MAVLCCARLVVAVVPFHRWRHLLGAKISSDGGPDADAALVEAQRSAAVVERAAVRLPFESKCLPRAMALSWLLRRKQIGHAFVFAVRPDHLRSGPDRLHAWVEIDGTKVIGDLPGPWLETLRLGG
jgi:hypothetical protein